MQQAARNVTGWKLLAIMLLGLTGLFIVLVALASSQPRGAVENRSGGMVRVQGEQSGASNGEDAATFLKDFEMLPGTAVLIDDNHVLAVYKKSDKEFYAVVLFSVDCDTSGCTPNELLAFSIVDGQGDDVQLVRYFKAPYTERTQTSI